MAKSDERIESSTVHAAPEANGERSSRKRSRKEPTEDAGADSEAEAGPPAPPAVDEDSDEDVGPMPLPADAETTSRKKRRTLPHEGLYLSQLPSAERYSKSFMHRDTINFVTVTRGTGFVITTSVDGHVKFWKKTSAGIEFVKHYRASLSPIVGVSASADGAMFAITSADGEAKVFDVVNFGEWTRV